MLIVVVGKTRKASFDPSNNKSRHARRLTTSMRHFMSGDSSMKSKLSTKTKVKEQMLEPKVLKARKKMITSKIERQIACQESESD